MPQSYGKIKEGDSAVIENIPILFKFNKNPRSGLTKWQVHLNYLLKKI